MQIVLKTSYKKDISLLISPQDFKNKYLFGIELNRYGNEVNDEVLINALKSAQEWIEEFLQLKLIHQVYWEDKHFWSEDWKAWGYIPTQFPVRCALEVSGWLGTIRQTKYPREWLSVKGSIDNQYLHRMIYMVPNVNSTYNQVKVFQGILPNINYMANRQIPNYWRVVYSTGFDIDKIPATILDVIGKIATMNILGIISDGLMPFPGVASTSISLDGLSQNLSSVANSQSGIFGARLKQYADELGGKDGKSGALKRLYDTYAAIPFNTA